jgi:hypothetical protein
VLENARLLEPDGDQALITTREALIALDAWSLFRTGELVAGRLKFVEPVLTVVRLPDGRVRLLGQADRPSGPAAVRPGPVARRSCRDRGRGRAFS